MSSAIEEITIPLVWNPPPVSCRLVRWLVRDGEHVCLGQGIYELEVEDTICEVESFFTGSMKQLVPSDTACKVGDRVAKIVLDKISTRFRTLPLYLSGQEITVLDSLRGDIPREVFIRDTILRSISSTPNTSKQAGASDGDKPSI